MISKEYDTLTEQYKQLVDSCISAQKLSYAPYSKFNVGTSLLMENGETIVGANQENAAYPLCLCAERVALSYAAMHHPGKAITSIAISTSADLQDGQIPAAPCGACRQVLMEYRNRQAADFDIYLVGKDRKCWVYSSIGELLPHTFDGTYFQ